MQWKSAIQGRSFLGALPQRPALTSGTTISGRLRCFLLPWVLFAVVLLFSPHCRALGKMWYLKVTGQDGEVTVSPWHPRRIWDPSAGNEAAMGALLARLQQGAAPGAAWPATAQETADLDALVHFLYFTGPWKWPQGALEEVLKRPGPRQAALNSWVVVQALESARGDVPDSEAGNTGRPPFSRQFLLGCTARARRADQDNAFPVLLERFVLGTMAAPPAGLPQASLADGHMRPESTLAQDALLKVAASKPYYDTYANLAAQHLLRAFNAGHSMYLEVRVQGVNTGWQRSFEYLLPSPEAPASRQHGAQYQLYQRLGSNASRLPLSLSQPVEKNGGYLIGGWGIRVQERELRNTSLALTNVIQTATKLTVLAGLLWLTGGLVLLGTKAQQPRRLHVWACNAVALGLGGVLTYSAHCCDDGSLLLGETSSGFALQAATLVALVIPPLVGWVLILRGNRQLRNSWHYEGRHRRRLRGLNAVGGRWEVVLLLILVAHIVSGLLVWNAVVQWLTNSGQSWLPLAFLLPQPWGDNRLPVLTWAQAYLGQLAIVGTYCLALYWLFRLRFCFQGPWRLVAHNTLATWRSALALWAICLSWAALGAGLAQIPLEHELERRVMALQSRRPQNPGSRDRATSGVVVPSRQRMAPQ